MNPYVNSIGGDAINPNPFTYSNISMSGDITLIWPFNDQTGTYVATSWVDITSTAAYAATMPDATQSGVGQESVFNNYGSFTVTIKKSDGSSITTVTSGETKRIWVTDSSTAAGIWRVANIGSGTTSADASALAGYGLIALAGQLSQQIPSLTYSASPQTLGAGHRAAGVEWTGGAGTFNLTAPATLGSGWFTHIVQQGSGLLTITPASGTINGAASITAVNGEGFIIYTDGVNFFTIGKIIATTAGATQLSKSVAGNTDVTLTATEAAFNILDFTGVLTGDINVIVPVTIREWIVYNATTGAHTLTVKTASGTGITVTQATRVQLYSDGTNVNRSDSAGVGTVTNIATGTGLTGGPITTTGTISLANTAVAAGTYGAAMGFPTLTVDAQGRLTSMAYQARNITGTADKITVTNGDGVSGAPTLTIAATYVGQNTITTLGTITTGVWNGTVLTPTYGGTGLSTLTANNLLVGAGTGNITFIAPGTSGNVLTSNGTTWASAAPVGLAAASQAQMETATSTAVASTPGRQQFHPGHPKVWAYVTVSLNVPTLVASYNVTSITDTAAGRLTINIDTDFSSASYCSQVSVEVTSNTPATNLGMIGVISRNGIAAGSIEINCYDFSPSLRDPASWHYTAFGDQ